jgi:hypothetical protein
MQDRVFIEDDSSRNKTGNETIRFIQANTTADPKPPACGGK